MTKTKDEILAEMLQAEKRTMATDRELAGFSEGCRKMYDHRQKEIDEAYERGKRDFIEATILYEAGKEDADKWWAERWRVFYESGDQPTYNGIIDELNAAAARVMRLDAIKELQEDGQEMEVKG